MMHKNSTQHRKMVLRRIDVTKYFAQGLTQFEIGLKINATQATVSRDLKALEQEWRQEAITELDRFKAQELIKINWMEREALEAWKKSKGEKERKSRKESDLLTGKRSEIGITKETNTGDPRYLQVVQWCIEKRCKLLGLDAPTELLVANIIIDPPEKTNI